MSDSDFPHDEADELFDEVDGEQAGTFEPPVLPPSAAPEASDATASGDSAEPSGVPAALLEERLRELRQKVAKQQKRGARRRLLSVACGLLILMASFVGLCAITSSIFQLDAHALTQVGRHEIERRLPAGRAGFAGFLKVESPRVVASGLAAIVDSLPLLRQGLVDEVERKLGLISAELEARLAEEMRRSLYASRAQLDASYPDAEGSEKIEKLLEQVNADFEKSARIAIDEIYPQYAAEMNRIRSFLAEGEVPGVDLSPREERQRKLIQTLVKLMIREKHGA